MNLAPDIASAVGIAAERWAASPSTLPLVIRKTPDGGAECVQAFPLMRYTRQEFAAALNFKDVRTLAKVLDRYGVTPAKDGQFDAETVEWVRDQMKADEGRKSPHELRVMRRDEGRAA